MISGWLLSLSPNLLSGCYLYQVSIQVQNVILCLFLRCTFLSPTSRRRCQGRRPLANFSRRFVPALLPELQCPSPCWLLLLEPHLWGWHIAALRIIEGACTSSMAIAGSLPMRWCWRLLPWDIWTCVLVASCVNKLRTSQDMLCLHDWAQVELIVLRSKCLEFLGLQICTASVAWPESEWWPGWLNMSCPWHNRCGKLDQLRAAINLFKGQCKSIYEEDEEEWGHVVSLLDSHFAWQCAGHAFHIYG